jgi:hypothetical protein
MVSGKVLFRGIGSGVVGCVFIFVGISDGIIQKDLRQGSRYTVEPHLRGSDAVRSGWEMIAIGVFFLICGAVCLMDRSSKENRFD